MPEITREFGTAPRWLDSRLTQKLLLAAGVAAFAVECIYLVLIPPANGFENDLIAAYPPLFWACFAIILACTILLFVAAATTASAYWVPGFVLLASNYAVFFYLPAHRGYKLFGRGSSDTLAHLGFVKGILAQHTIDLKGLFYPFEHLFMAELSMMGLDLATTQYTFSLVFTLLFIASFGLLLRQFVGESRAVSLGLCAATPLVFTYFHVRIHPSMFSILLFPLVLFVLERYRTSGSKRYVLIFLALVFAIVFFHPTTTVFLLVLVLSTIVFQHLYDLVTQFGIGTESEIGVQLPKLRSRLAFLFIPPALSWYVHFRRTRQHVTKILSNYLGTNTGTVVTSQIQRTEKAHLTLAQLMTKFVQKYGVVFLFCAMAGLFVLAVLRRARRDSRYEEVYASYQFAIGFVITLAFMVLYLIGFNPIRVARYMIVMAVFLVALLLWRTVDANTWGRRAILVLVVCSIFSAAVLGTFGGTTYWQNKQMTHAEYQGAEFMLDHHDTDHNIYSHDLTTKMERYIYGRTSTYIPSPLGDAYRLQPHLGYATNETAAQTYGTAYVVTHAHDLQYYKSDYYTEYQQMMLFIYGKNDVAQMRHDPTVQKVYANGGFTGWYVTNRSLQNDRREAG